MKRSLKVSWLLLFLAANVPECARSDTAGAVFDDEHDNSSHSIAPKEPLARATSEESIRYHHDSLFQRHGGTTRDFLRSPAPTQASPTKTASPTGHYFYESLFSLTRNSPPTLPPPTSTPSTSSLPTPSPSPKPSERLTPQPSPPLPTPFPVMPTAIPPTPFPPTPSPLPEPSNKPTASPLPLPTPSPSPRPTAQPTLKPIEPPTEAPPTFPPPTITPTPKPTTQPTPQPLPPPTPQVTFAPVEQPTPFTFSRPLSFEAGNFSMGLRSTDGIVFLSNGLSARPIAQTGERVKLVDGVSDLKFHKLPDGAAVFPAKNGKKGWLYASNSESDKRGTNWDDGGVGVLEFNEFGEVTNYYRIANNTKRNCGGGATPWNSWVTCEEVKDGQIHQTDPYGVKGQQVTALGKLGSYESFAYWDDGRGNVTFYATRDQKDGVVTRFTPDAFATECYRQSNDYDRWCTLNSGTIEYLYLVEETGKVEWIEDERKASDNAKKLYPSCEGIDVHNDVLYFTSKEDKLLVIVDLWADTYTSSSTKSGAFNNQPDQVDKVLGANARMLLLCEDGGLDAGLHGRSPKGDYFTVLYRDKGVRSSHKSEETTGLGVSPDFKHVYVSFQHVGVIYDVTREDGRSFDSRLLDIKYHAMDS